MRIPRIICINNNRPTRFIAKYNLTKVFLSKHKDVESFLDIGCGDGVLLKLINKNIDYMGVDADVGIKKKKKHNKIKYFKNASKTEKYLINLKKKI